MSPFKLNDYAHHSQKIPTNLLNHHLDDKSPSHWKVLGAHLIDYGAVSFASLAILVLFNVGVSQLMMTSKLEKVFDKMNMDSVTLFTFAVTAFTYFFFSYFFNHGQTYGLSVTKCRITMKEMDVKHSLRWSLISIAVIASFGLLYNSAISWMKKSGMGEYAVEDYLYHNLLEVKLHEVQLTVPAEHHEEHYIQEAA